MYTALFFVVGSLLSAMVWMILGVASRFRTTARRRRLAWASALGPASIAVVLVISEARAGLSSPGLQTAGALALGAGLGGLAFWLVGLTVTRSAFHQKNS